MFAARLARIGGVALGVTIAGAALVAWDSPGTKAMAGSEVNATCGFAIRGSNDLDQDVYVYLYTSYVYHMSNVLIGWRQLKIQNYRIAPNKSMDVRYTAAGSCGARRHWYIKVKGDRKPFCVWEFSSGDDPDPQTVNIGPASRWYASTNKSPCPPPVTDERAQAALPARAQGPGFEGWTSWPGSA